MTVMVKYHFVCDGSVKYSFMHDDVDVATIRADAASGTIRYVSVLDPVHMPLLTVDEDGDVDQDRFRGWWFFRSMGVEDNRPLLLRSGALSLSDHYWVRPEGSDIGWADMNHFDNDFRYDLGDLLFGSPVDRDSMGLASPDITTEGNLRKRWRIVDGTRCLIKGGSGESLQEPLNERVASLIMDALGIDHVRYDVIWDDGRPYSVCPDFVDGDTEFISAFHVNRSMENRDGVSVYAHYVRCCAENGLDIVPALDRMIVVDYITVNNDRHMNNFGIIRDPRTL